MNHILLVQSEMLLSAGVESLLAHEGDFVVKSTQAKTSRELIGEIIRFKPQVLVFDDSLASLIAPLLLDLFDFVPRMRILRVSYWTNHIQVYWYKDVDITGTEDLLAAVRQESICSSLCDPYKLDA